MEAQEIKDALSNLEVSIKSANETERKNALAEFETKFNSAIENQVKTVKDELEAQLKAVQDHADKLDIKLQEKTVETKGTSIELEVKEKKDAIKSLANRTSFSEVEIKADTNRASVVGNQQAVELSDIGQLATRKLSMYDVFPKISVSSSNNNGTIRYYDWDEATTARAAAMVAEGAAFPESTAKSKTVTIDIKRAGDTLPVTEEFFEDEAMFAGELRQFLITNVDLKIDDQ